MTMNIQIFGTKKSSDTRKAERFFKERGIKFQSIDLKEKGLSKGEFNSVMQAVGGVDAMFQSYVNPEKSIPPEVSALNHITDDMLQAAPMEKDIYPEFMKFLGDAVLGKIVICGHVAAFDLSFLCRILERLGIEADFRFVDTRQLATQISWPEDVREKYKTYLKEIMDSD